MACKLLLALAALLLSLLSPCHGQYSADEIDVVNGATLAECTFYGDHTVDCAGRLRCHPSDVQERVTMAVLDRACAREPTQKSGTWDSDQVIPVSAIRNAGSGRLAKCTFYANRGQGSFNCVGTNGDAWKGKYTGTMNTAFKLGLPFSQPGQQQSPYPAGALDGLGGSPTGALYPSSTGARYPAGSVYGDRDRYNTATAEDDYGYHRPGPTTRRYPAYELDRDRDGRYSAGVGLPDRYGSASGRPDRYNANDRDSLYPASRGITTQITMCTYTNDGQGTCRGCEERVEKTETTTQIRTTKHYTCSGPTNPTTWTENNGVMKAGIWPDRYARDRRIVATCIFRPSLLTFECHGGSDDGSCGLSGSSPGSGSGSGDQANSLSRCLTGDKWTGTYSGSIY